VEFAIQPKPLFPGDSVRVVNGWDSVNDCANLGVMGDNPIVFAVCISHTGLGEKGKIQPITLSSSIYADLM